MGLTGKPGTGLKELSVRPDGPRGAEMKGENMGQKVNPHGLRVGVIKDWDSRWYADAEFSDFLVEDYNIRKFLK